MKTTVRIKKTLPSQKYGRNNPAFLKESSYVDLCPMLHINHYRPLSQYLGSFDSPECNT